VRFTMSVFNGMLSFSQVPLWTNPVEFTDTGKVPVTESIDPGLSNMDLLEASTTDQEQLLLFVQARDVLLTASVETLTELVTTEPPKSMERLSDRLHVESINAPVTAQNTEPSLMETGTIGRWPLSTHNGDRLARRHDISRPVTSARTT
jgi:hypothetical protein